MKKALDNIVVLLFSASVIIGCMQPKVQKDQNVVTSETKKMEEPSVNYKDIEGKLEELGSLLKERLITEDEYYKTRAKVLEGF